MLDAAANFVQVQASTGYSSSATSIDLNSGQGAKLPAAPHNLIWWNSTDYPNPATDPNVEIVRVTGVSTDTLAITRAQEGTSASNKNTSGKTYSLVLGITAKTISDIDNFGVVGQLVSGTIDGSNTAFTIPTAVNGKTLTFCNGQLLGIEGVNYTRVGTTITYSSAPPNGYDATSHYLICIG